MQSHLGPVTRGVADNLDGAVGHDVQRAVSIAQDRAAHGDLFHSAVHARGANRVADLELVFHQNKKSVDHIFDQGLRAKANGQAGNPRAGEQRLNVD